MQLLKFLLELQLFSHDSASHLVATPKKNGFAFHEENKILKKAFFINDYQ